MAHRKIYIGKTYTTKQGGLFYVSKIEKGNPLYNNQNFKGREVRRAIDENGNRLKITNLLKIVENN